MKNNKSSVSYLWVIPLALLFPMLQNIIFFIRFAKLPVDIMMNSLIFIPMGLISGALFIYLINKKPMATKRIVIGYIIGAIVGIPLSVLSGLIVPPIIATGVMGTLPLVLGAFVGYTLSDINKG